MLSTLILGTLVVVAVLAGALATAWLTYRHPTMRHPIQAAATFTMLAVTAMGILVATAQYQQGPHRPPPVPSHPLPAVSPAAPRP
ncbi:hypothetical protein [Streptomyces sp. NPDC090021]|uniref:hypothetical protein n=1 Tax=Streptomyces sp. NPDC090021 TaxID=3365919 RepID=UPI0038133DFB